MYNTGEQIHTDDATQRALEKMYDLPTVIIFTLTFRFVERTGGLLGRTFAAIKPAVVTAEKE